MTDGLNGMADRLSACGVDTVAVESTGVYWIAVYEVLERRGLMVRRTDAPGTAACGPAAGGRCMRGARRRRWRE
jgi:hypothetical protein